ncbi:hypothetical protein [Dictyobacter kobayashii]|uniref:Uncharacterized protein n=1 Tax=Dictyobacter kobayashii TaxID=2014872 RepID=A0A402AVM9_9CHLR|nr:hypothetical protein [Dictyobacter kobayashii]GCE23134.1 hypothetical protein KDK_69340 [Dictyobacter kobayashii]
MKDFSLILKLFVKRFFLPVGSLSKELAPYDPVDKPILYYEALLFRIVLILSFLGKTIIIFNVLEMRWNFLLSAILLLLLAIVIFNSLFHLIIPPRFSASRLAIIVVSSIMFLVLISK